MFELKNNAVFIADSHYNKKHTLLKTILENIDSQKIKTEQLILMGDIFDFLSSHVTYFVNINQNIIDLINSISQKVEVIYFEGNHDFLIQDTFPKVKVYKREQQPLLINHKDKTIGISHGDIFTPFGYNLYTYIIRTKWLLRFLNLFDINNWITKKIEAALMSKKICGKYHNFDQTVKTRSKLYGCDLVIEGHFHQSVLNGNYINIPSLACDKKYLIYIDNQFNFVSI